MTRPDRRATDHQRDRERRDAHQAIDRIYDRSS